jgi:hypothetical protein
MEAYRPLILRANRYLGSVLIRADLVDDAAVEKASHRFLERIQKGEYQNAAILNILVLELQVLREATYIDYQVEKHQLGLVDLSGCEIEADLELDQDLCRVTWTLPFDKIGDHHLVATTSQLSRPIVQEWEKKLGEKIFWFATTLNSMTSALEQALPRPNVPAG